MSNKYLRLIKVQGDVSVWVDVYDVLKAFDVTCPALAHAVKKCLAPGQRGAKNSVQDKNEAIASIKRSVELESTLHTRGPAGFPPATIRRETNDDEQ